MVWMCLEVEFISTMGLKFEFIDKLMISYGEHLLSTLLWSIYVPADRVRKGRWWHFLLCWIYTNIFKIKTIIFLFPSFLNLFIRSLC